MSDRMTIKERDEVRRIINEQEEKEIALLTANDPEWEQRVEDRKNKVAVGKLGIAREAAELAAVEKKIEELKKRLDEINARIEQKLPRQSRDKSDRYSRRACPGRKTLCEAIADIANAIHSKEVAADKTGKLIAQAIEKARTRRANLEKCSNRNDLTLFKVL